jgi:hypothetical protein
VASAHRRSLAALLGYGLARRAEGVENGPDGKGCGGCAHGAVSVPGVEFRIPLARSTALSRPPMLDQMFAWSFNDGSVLMANGGLPGRAC